MLNKLLCLKRKKHKILYVSAMTFLYVSAMFCH